MSDAISQRRLRHRRRVVRKPAFRFRRTQPLAHSPGPLWRDLAAASDTAIVNVAQQKIKRDSTPICQRFKWILDSYILAFAVLMLSFGRIGDIYGRKKMFVTGMAVFIAASGLCGISHWIADLIGIPGATALIIARVQGIGGALMMPQTLSLITVAFPPQKRGAAMGVWGSVVALGAVLGPLLGGYIVTHYPWEWVFLINIPVGSSPSSPLWRSFPNRAIPWRPASSTGAVSSSPPRRSSPWSTR